MQTTGKLHTTRPRRDENDDEYIFTDRKPNELHPVKCEFNGWWYYLNHVQLDADIFILGPKMAQQMKDLKTWNVKFLTIFIDIPESIRYERLMKREMPGDTVIARIGRDRADFAHFTDYDIRIHENHAEQPIVIASVVHFLNESPC